MNNKRCSPHIYSSGNSKGFRSSVSGTGYKDQIYIFLIISQMGTITLNINNKKTVCPHASRGKNGNSQRNLWASRLVPSHLRQNILISKKCNIITMVCCLPCHRQCASPLGTEGLWSNTCHPTSPYLAGQRQKSRRKDK